MFCFDSYDNNSRYPWTPSASNRFSSSPGLPYSSPEEPVTPLTPQTPFTPTDAQCEQNLKEGSCNVYISNLPQDATDAWLRNAFQQFGLIVSAKVMPKKGKTKNQVYGFVQFLQPESALGSCAINGVTIDGLLLTVKLADRDKDKGISNIPSNNLYVGNIPDHWGASEVTSLFSPFGPIMSLVVLSDPATQRSKGVALVRFAYVEDATNAITSLNALVLPDATDLRPLEVKFAENKQEKFMRKGHRKQHTDKRFMRSSASEPQLSMLYSGGNTPVNLTPSASSGALDMNEEYYSHRQNSLMNVQDLEASLLNLQHNDGRRQQNNNNFGSSYAARKFVLSGSAPPWQPSSASSSVPVRSSPKSPSFDLFTGLQQKTSANSICTPPVVGSPSMLAASRRSPPPASSSPTLGGSGGGRSPTTVNNASSTSSGFPTSPTSFSASSGYSSLSTAAIASVIYSPTAIGSSIFKGPVDGGEQQWADDWASKSEASRGKFKNASSVGGALGIQVASGPTTAATSSTSSVNKGFLIGRGKPILPFAS